MTLTPKQARELWCSELESGKWKQGTGRLACETDTGTEYCCLGVACELAVREGIIEAYDGNACNLYSGRPGKVREWLGLTGPEGDYGKGAKCLTSDNDSGQSFKEIAATIRNEPEGLIT
jgi:hypothetical protein